MLPGRKLFSIGPPLKRILDDLRGGIILTGEMEIGCKMQKQNIFLLARARFIAYYLQKSIAYYS